MMSTSPEISWIKAITFSILASEFYAPSPPGVHLRSNSARGANDFVRFLSLVMKPR